jgi:Flp pilus assembly protein TadG
VSPTSSPAADRRVPADHDRGSVTVEMVIMFPLIVTFLFLVVLAGRVTDAKGDVVSAANDAARVASLQATQAAAEAQALDAAEATLAGEGVDCIGGVRVDLTVEGPEGFARGAVVVADVSCDVRTSDLLLLNVGPGVVTVRDEGREPVDAHRSL